MNPKNTNLMRSTNAMKRYYGKRGVFDSLDVVRKESNEGVQIIPNSYRVTQLNFRYFQKVIWGLGTKQ